jgi:hypothetical protein
LDLTLLKKLKTIQHWYLEIFIKKLKFHKVPLWKDLISNPFQENQQEENVGCESLIDPTILK